MAHVKENDTMIDFYLCPTLLQKEILDKYQQLAANGKNRESLLNFLEAKFSAEIHSNREDDRLPA